MRSRRRKLLGGWRRVRPLRPDEEEVFADSIAEAERELAEGRTIPAEEVFAEIDTVFDAGEKLTAFLADAGDVVAELIRGTFDQRIEDIEGSSSFEDEELRMVSRLGRSQKEALAENRGKKHWRHEEIPDDYFFARLIEEIIELRAAVRHARHQEATGGFVGTGFFARTSTLDRVWREAADVANFAAMIADRL